MTGKCRCGEVVEVQSLTFLDDYITTTSECSKCERRVHRMYKQTSETFFINGEVEKE